MTRLSLLALALSLVLAARAARAQPELAQIHDDKELADAIAAIAPDPAAQALIREGVRQQQAQAYDQALANFLAAYDKVPSPKLLLLIASTLRDMGRLADAANSYERYLADPSSGGERTAEVKELLARLDQQLTVLVVHVALGAQVSIDGGPFVLAGSELVTRVRPGLHLVRVRGPSATELTVNGFEGETKGVGNARETGHEVVYGWLVTGTQYVSANAVGNERRVRTGYAGPELAPIMPRIEASDSGVAARAGEPHLASGVVALARIDGEGRGFAGGLGIAYSPQDRVELELAGLRSQFWGAYLGARYRFWTRRWRPYLAAGVPSFFFTDDAMRTKVALGARVAGGIELVVNPHVSIAADLGYEHFFDVSEEMVGGERLEADYFIPTVGLIGRM